MAPEREKAGLLPARPGDDVAGSANTARVSSRRPADVFIPGALGKPSALDLACTSGLRGDRLASAINDPEKIVADYETFKRGFVAPARRFRRRRCASSRGLSSSLSWSRATAAVGGEKPVMCSRAWPATSPRRSVPTRTPPACRLPSAFLFPFIGKTRGPSCVGWSRRTQLAGRRHGTPSQMRQATRRSGNGQMRMTAWRIPISERRCRGRVLAPCLQAAT